MYPLKFSPITIDTIWGWERWALSSVEGRESLLLSSHTEDDGASLPALIAKYTDRLVGKRVWEKFGNKFPLLVKFIKAEAQLSVQVHPDEKMAHAKGLPNGKNEMWYILDAKEDASIMLGFNRGVLREEFTALRGEEMVALLNTYRVQSGDYFYIPAGTVHSIGAGSFLLEIQQSSDTTYRLYDFDRVDVAGRKRALDRGDALSAIHFENSSGRENKYRKNVFAQKGKPIQLIDSKDFTSTFINLEGLKGDEYWNLDFSSFGSFSIIVCTHGTGEVHYLQEGRESLIKIKAEDVYLLPAELGSVRLFSSGQLQIIETHLQL